MDGARGAAPQGGRERASGSSLAVRAIRENIPAVIEEQIGCAVIGAGVVGLACARALARAGREVVVLDAADRIGTGTSSRSSEVIHAGLYYAPGSLKARLCVEGKAALYAYCRDKAVPHRRLGKLVVGSFADRARLEALRARARGNGVEDLVWLEPAELRELEPALAAELALYSPSTGIVDAHALMEALAADARAARAVIALRSPVTGGEVLARGAVLEVGGDEPFRLRCGLVVNAAGLDAQAVAWRLRGFPAHFIPKRYLAKGSYFALRGKSPFSRLIYPLPEAGGLGIHLTLDLAGQARFGPDVEWVDAPDYAVDERRRPAFERAIRRYWPQLPDGALQPAFAAVRPKLVPPGAPDGDFVIQGAAEHGVPGWINLFGIESPGLTAALAIAEEVAALERSSRGGKSMPAAAVPGSLRQEALMTTQRAEIDIQTADGIAHAWTYRSGEGERPAVILYADAFGIRPTMHQMAERLAGLGYLVLLPNIFYRAGEFAPFDAATVWTNPSERERLMKLIHSITPERVGIDSDAYLSAIAAQPNVRADRVGATGYCMGGRMAILTAGKHPSRLRAAASFHGGRLVTDEPESPHRLADRFQAALYFGVADEDAGCTPEHQAELAKVLGAAHVPYCIELYRGKKHGFAVPDHPGAYSQDAAERHWRRLESFFGENLAAG